MLWVCGIFLFVLHGIRNKIAVEYNLNFLEDESISDCAAGTSSI